MGHSLIQPVKREKLKQGLLRGKSIRQSMKDAGWSEKTAHGHCDQYEPVVKGCIDEIMAEFKVSDITVSKVLSNLYEDRELARKKNDIATMKEVDALLGKYLAMFTEKQAITQDIKLTDQQKAEIVNRIKQYSITPVNASPINTTT